MKSNQLQHVLFCCLFAGFAQYSFGQAVAEKKLQGGITASVGGNFIKMGTSLLEAQPGLSTAVGINFMKTLVLLFCSALPCQALTKQA